MSIRVASRINIIPSSPTLTLNNKAKEMASQGIKVINFGVGEPDFNTPDYIKEAGIEAIKSNFTRYTANAGILELRKAISEKYKKDNELSYQPDDILVSAGAKASLFYSLMAVCEPGDKILIPLPYWVSYPSLVMLTGGEPVYVKTNEADSFKITAEQIEECVKEKGKIRMLIMNSPNNPTGAVYTREELSKIAEVCIKHDICVLSDEIYEKLVYDGTEFVSIAQISEEMKARTIIVNGVSKSFAMTGWRLGFSVGPTNIIKAAGKIQEHAASNVNSITQKAALAAYTKDDGSVERMRMEFEKRKYFLVNALRDIPNVTCMEPKGAFYAVPNISWYIKNNKIGIKNSNDLSLYLLEKCHIAAVGGDSFGMDDIVRFSYANSTENLIEGVRRFKEGLSILMEN
ncbi:MAG: pyridoxal phosphate-dependent aminotransferase [Candidatus Cloacimonetes bacterium]|nr:pyridoxal phosphate-dependent aminotransferase [Candidatus Cloacimonadota bacterium]